MRPLIALIGLACVLALVTAPLQAQDATPEATFESIAGEGVGITFGARETGAIDADQPRAVYVFEGLRGDRVRLALDVTDGDLAPVVLLVNEAGAVVERAEAGGSLRLDSIRLPAAGVYSIVVTRFGGAVGSTSGEYELALDRLGASADSGSGLRYGDRVIGELNGAEPTRYYTFRARRGDVLTMQMQRLSGDLDPSLTVTDATGRVIASNDEILGSGSLDAAIDSLIIQDDGVYVLIASRFGGEAGNSAGDFLLTLDTAANSAMGTSALLAIPIEPGETVDGALSDDRYAQFYRFEGRRDDTVSVRMSRAGGDLDTLVALADSSLRELTSNDDSGGSQNSAVDGYVLPADGVYYVIATRYERASGQTSGAYQLELTNGGSVFAEAAPDALRLDYGSTVAGFIDDLTPTIRYAFQGQAGDVITIGMSRGDGTLDPFVTLLDANQTVLASDDDSAGQQNARIDRYTLPETGVYYIEAGRFSDPAGGTPTSGGFILVLAQRFD